MSDNEKVVNKKRKSGKSGWQGYRIKGDAELVREALTQAGLVSPAADVALPILDTHSWQPENHSIQPLPQA